MRFRAPSYVWLTAVVILAAVSIPGQLLAQAPTTVAGHWEGAINLPGQELRIVVELTKAEGAWRGVIDIPAQGAQDLPLGEVTVEGPSISFVIPGIPGRPSFKGTLSADGNGISGDFSQGGQVFPFKLARKADPAQVAAQALAGIGEFIKAAMKDWKVPGLSVAVVKDDVVVFIEGFGLRDVNRGLPVTKDTLFAIGSSTKAFTAMTLALLIEDGKLSWDTPVRTYLPTFKLKDEVAREHITPRDLVSHRSGLPRHDFVWYNASLTRKEMVDRLEHIEPNVDFRAKWQYQNLMFMTAGYLAGQVAGTTWEDLVRRRIFQPLGMNNSNFSVEDSQKRPDYALPYQEKEKLVRQIPFRNISAVGPAGSINSSANEMAQWLRLQLGKGRVGNAQVLSASEIAEMHSPQVVIPVRSVLDPEITNPSYGLGWIVESYRGRARIQHGGAIDGFRCQVAFVPDAGVGVVVLANLGGTQLTEVVANTITDKLLGLPPIDWSARWLKRREAAQQASERAKQKADVDRKPGTRPAHPLDDYVADYEHAAYGTISVARDGADGLKATFHAIPMRLEHWHYETFRALPEDPALSEQKLFLLFHANAKGDVDRLSLPLEPQTSEIVFLRKPPARLSDPGFLKALTGAFVMADNPSITINFELKGDKLTASIAGQPPRDLDPYQGTEFKLKGLTGYSVRFILDAKGGVSEALLIQPDGVYTLKKKA